ncbi:ASCH domain-containing protein [Longirhabdus pacifica]|uniref:ASCH domain-containing protein n=1 Tax=Longirhabdus pacifica TaxID=2305227 RepID=UPI001008E1F1|nr:ASCH domain-containing protein [Longirhabdus pacifica]
MMHPSVITMWNHYSQNKNVAHESYSSWYFCDNEKDANHLAELVLKGKKTATSSLKLFYELEQEQLPKIGDHSVITDWNGLSKAVIKTIDVKIIPFQDVVEAYAYKEGEGDRSLAYWRMAHIDFFTRELSAIHREFDEAMLIVWEEFEVVFPILK